MEFDSNRSPANVGGHGEVSDGSYHGDTSGDVVKDAVLAGLRGRKTHEDNCRSGHYGADSPVPVGAVICKVDLRRATGVVDGTAI